MTLALFALGLLLSPLLVTPPSLHAEEQAQKIVIAGAQSIVPLAEEFSIQFRKAHPKAAIEIRGGGSNYGVVAARQGEAHVGHIARELSAAEKTHLQIIFLGRDAIIFMTYPGNPVRDLTLAQLRRVYSAQVANWRELGGEDKGIVPLTREPGSALHATFAERLFGKNSEAREKAFTIRASKEKILNTIKRVSGCIGYGIVRPEEAEAQGVRILAIEGMLASSDNVSLGLYPFTRSQFLLTKERPTPLADEWARSFAAFVKQKAAGQEPR